MNSSFPDYLKSSQKLSQYLKHSHFYPKKKLGQNFLIDQNINKIIIDALTLNKTESIFEIGTGLGALTFPLIAFAQHVFSIDKDIRLKPILEDILSVYQGFFTILYQDVLTFDLAHFFQEKNQQGYNLKKIVGNLPYCISLPLLRKLMEMHHILDLAVVMVQKEVAQRMMAHPGDKNYGMLSVMSQYYSRVEKIHQVSPEVFFPKPEVESMIIRIHFFKQPAIWVEDETLFFDLVRASFRYRRKNMSNALKLYFGEKLDKQRLEKTLQDLGFDLSRRGEDFDLPEFAQLTREMKKLL